jgi:hypothetical protein
MHVIYFQVLAQHQSQRVHYKMIGAGAVETSWNALNIVTTRYKTCEMCSTKLEVPTCVVLPKPWCQQGPNTISWLVLEPRNSIVV